MDNRIKEAAIIVSFGIIVANLAISSSSVLVDFSPFPVTTSWFYGATLICGLLMGITLDESSASLYGVALMALIATSIFGGVLVLTAVLGASPILDLVVLFSFQQTFPRFIFICVLGYAGVFGSFLLKLFLGQS